MLLDRLGFLGDSSFLSGGAKSSHKKTQTICLLSSNYMSCVEKSEKIFSGISKGGPTQKQDEGPKCLAQGHLLWKMWALRF